jgi:fibronectin-binding autotransporter adhesin
VLLGLALASPTVGATLGAGGGAPRAGGGGAGGGGPGALGGAPAAGFDPGAGTVSNEMHAVGYAAKCLALAHREAANKMLQCGSAFLHPGAEAGGGGGGGGSATGGGGGGGAPGGGQAADALEAFSRVAAAVIYSRWAAGGGVGGG